MHYIQVQESLLKNQKRWLVTGVAGFIGSNLAEALLKLNQAVTKYVNELYMGVFHKCYGMEAIGLRYFNVFGKRQDPNGAYAAVIPKWIGQILNGEDLFINGDGETSRDFTYIDNVVQANILAATTDNPEAYGQAFNTAIGGRETLNNLYQGIVKGLKENLPELEIKNAIY